MELSHAANPFALMTNPEAVLRAIENSDKLCMLERRVCRPLDRTPSPKAEAAVTEQFDQEIDDVELVEGE
ncbi:MAG: hypothetical protein JWQ11_1641 [Rhizobacter sp.]|nr:hypothetical protein [Rhizobacter sp.]